MAEELEKVLNPRCFSRKRETVEIYFQEGKEFIIENNILKGTADPSPETRYTSLGEVILNNTKNDPEFVGQIDAVTGEKWSYKMMRDRSIRCALWMKAHGLSPSDIVIICTHNHLDLAMPCYAALYLGAIFNPLDVGLHPDDFRHMMKITEPKMAFVNEDTAETIARVAEEIKLDLKIVVFGRIPGFLEFGNILTEAKDDEVKNFKHTPLKNLNDTAVIMCTSGTTGRPKGVELGHSVFFDKISRRDYTLARHNAFIFSPLAWYSGMCNLIMSICMDATRIVLPPFEENLACQLIERYKPSVVSMSPYLITRMVKSDAIRKYDLSSLKEILCSGSPLSVATQRTLTEMIPNAELVLIYGLTEVGCGVTCRVGDTKSGSCGRIVGSAQLKVIDPNTGEILGPRKHGEFCLKTSTMMNGYYKNPQATAETIDKEGQWLHSGDLGYFDEDGEIFIIDRIKELILYQTIHISPVEIEDILIAHPGVKDAAVSSLPHPVDDEHPIALVVRPDPDLYKGEVTEQELIDYVAARVADSKRLRGGVKFVDYIPKTASSKIRRREIRDLARSLAAM